MIVSHSVNTRRALTRVDVSTTIRGMARQPQPFQFDAADAASYDARLVAALSAEPSSAEAIAIQWQNSPVGPLLLGATDSHLVLLEFSDPTQLEAQLTRLRKHFARPLACASNPIIELVRTQLEGYFAGARRDFDVPLEVHGSTFQESVWAALRTIPYGETCSYGAIAKRLGDANAMRAVGAANGVNPIAIVIPCHRVVNANGELGGYGGGLWRKRVLLDLERGQGSLF